MVSNAARGAGKAAVFALGTVSLLLRKAMEDGHLAAAGRQGIDELGAGLKALPDSIQAHETGTIWNPTQGEVAADRKAAVFGSGMTTGRHGIHGAEHGQGVHGNTARTPSEIASERGGVHGPEHGHGQDHSNDNSRGR